jgi:hypothetical protein
MATIKFAGSSAAEVERKFLEWQAHNPDCPVTRKGAPVGVGDELNLVERGEWAMTIEYEDPLGGMR